MSIAYNEPYYIIQYVDKNIQIHSNAMWDWYYST